MKGRNCSSRSSRLRRVWRRPERPLASVILGLGVQMRGLRVWRQLDALGRAPLIQRVSHLGESGAYSKRRDQARVATRIRDALIRSVGRRHTPGWSMVGSRTSDRNTRTHAHTGQGVGVTEPGRQRRQAGGGPCTINKPDRQLPAGSGLVKRGFVGLYQV